MNIESRLSDTESLVPRVSSDPLLVGTSTHFAVTAGWVATGGNYARVIWNYGTAGVVTLKGRLDTDAVPVYLGQGQCFATALVKEVTTVAVGMSLVGGY